MVPGKSGAIAERLMVPYNRPRVGARPATGDRRAALVCGIAGIVDLAGTRPVPPGLIERMTASLVHRGPDEEGYLRRPGLAFGSRRLAIVGLGDGRQPIANEDQTVWTVYN